MSHVPIAMVLDFEMLIARRTQLRGNLRGLLKKFVLYVYKNFILKLLGYINMVPFKMLPIWHNKLVPLFALF